MNRIDDKEDVARMLKSVWIYDGIVSPSAFNLRPHIHETYISVLRPACDTFVDDVASVTRGQKQVPYALMNARGVRNLHVDTIADNVSFDVVAVDNHQLHSHAGIYISIDGQKVVGGEPFESLELKHGTSVDSVLLSIRESLAAYAQQNIKTITKNNA